MKQLIIITFGLLYAVYCKSPTPYHSDDRGDDYVYDDAMQNDDNYEIYQEQEETVSEDNNAAKIEQQVAIVTKGETFTRIVNETVVLPCAITGDDYVRVWRRHGAILYQGIIGMGAKDNMKLTNGNLEISNLQEIDAGDYECMAMISELNKPTIKHTLILHTPPFVEALTTKGSSQVLQSGDTLTLFCKARGNPKPLITWHKGSERLQITGEMLTIEHVRHHDAGEYKCLADNKVGDPYFKHIRISVEHKPVITIDQITVNSEDEQDTELKCIVHAEPVPQVVWKKDGVNIKNGPRTVLTNNKNVHILLLKKVEMSDFGVYTCSAVNSIGSTNKNITLVKTPAVVRFIKPRNDTRDVVLTWEVQSKSPISEHELQYRKKGKSDWELIKPEITKIENEVYTVKYVLTGLEPGVYETRIRSQNKHGWSEYSEIMPFEGVYAKHGHHKCHKKCHKDHKEAKGTQTVKSLDNEEPAEHQENVTIKHASVESNYTEDPETSSASIPSLSLAWISVALIVILQLRTPTISL